jgi:hypothetical protein
MGGLAERAGFEREPRRRGRTETSMVVRRLRDRVEVERPCDGEKRREEERGGSSDAVHQFPNRYRYPSA